MVIKTDLQDLRTYLEDSSNAKGMAGSLYLPENSNELLSAIAGLHAKKIPFTASSGRTGTTGGCVPTGGAIISLEKLKTALEIDPQTKTAKVDAGFSLDTLATQAHKFKLALRAAPTEPLALVGGAASTAASGVRGFGYGGIRNYIREIELCLANGEFIRIKRGQIFARGRLFDFALGGQKFKFHLPGYKIPLCKSQAGYFIKDDMDLIDLFIGSEGTLGIISSLALSLQDTAFGCFDGLLFFPKEEDALQLVEKIKVGGASLRPLPKPAALEFFDAQSLNLLRQYCPFIPSAQAAVYFEQEAENKEQYASFIEQWQDLIGQSSASADDSIFAETAKERERIFQIRHKLPQLINEFLRQHKQVKAAADIAVGAGKFRKMYRYYQQAAENSGLPYANFGHIGEAHLHFNFLPKDDAEGEQAKKYLEQLCRQAVALGGTVSAEHGIGKIKKPFLKLMYSDKEIREMAALKKYFDPDCLLGLDNIFDKELLFGK